MMAYLDTRKVDGLNKLVEVSEQEFFELMYAPINGVYDDAFRERAREHRQRVIERYDKLPNRGLPIDGDLPHKSYRE